MVGEAYFTLARNQRRKQEGARAKICPSKYTHNNPLPPSRPHLSQFSYLPIVH
jgi:hypothetical protein